MNEDRASRYHRLRRRAIIASTAAGAAWLLLLLYSGGAAALGRWADSFDARFAFPLGRALSVAAFVAVAALGYEASVLPFSLYRNFVLERKYGLSSEPLRSWTSDHLKALSLGLLLTTAAAAAIRTSMQLLPAWWWVVCALLFACAGVLIATVTPILLMPLFYRFRPLERESLRQRLLALSARAGVRVLGAFEWGLGEKTTRANAALVGLGRTRRILVSDTLLKGYSDDEIEVILAHEVGHHVHRDVWSALALDSVVIALALLGGHLASRQWGAAFGIGRPADLAVLPLIALAAGAVSLLLAPLSNAWSRYNERRADLFALTLTHRPAAFISAMRRLGAQNLADARPSAAVIWFFHTHPTIDERIETARRFRLP
jgi:STE24 endopeptidase